MSTISAINQALVSTPFSGTQNVSSGQDSDGDHDGSSVAQAPGGGGKFASAISQALSQLSVSVGAGSASGASAASASPTQDSQQALATFILNLFAALQAQGGQNAPPSSSAAAATGAKNSEGVNGVANASGQGHHHRGGMSKLEGGLQNLIQQLSSSSGSSAGAATSTSTATATSASASTSSSSTLDALQQSFNNLLAASGSQATLASFLQSLSQNLQGAPATGNVISTQA